MPTRVKVLVILLSIAGVGAFVSLAFVGGGGTSCTTPDAIVEVFPRCNESVFQQSAVSVEVASGYRAELSLNGTPLPLDEIDTDQDGTDLVDAAPNRYTYFPGENKTVEQLLPNQNCVDVTYWPIAEGEAAARQYRWCFRAA
ncbi:MAG TPA: hypothetical protein VF183_11500 [Acidimicrobiales bacterium]